MRRIIKGETPAFWAKFCRKHPKARYDDLNTLENGKETRAELRRYLLAEQKYLCCYCCRQIEESKCHNEHICPRNSETKHNSMDYHNLVASCDELNTCGKKKDCDYDFKRFVSPIDENCESHYRFKYNGKIEGLTEQGKYTIELLNLNAYELVQARKALYDECCLMSQLDKDCFLTEYIKPKDGRLHAFFDMINFFYSQGKFDL